MYVTLTTVEEALRAEQLQPEMFERIMKQVRAKAREPQATLPLPFLPNPFTSAPVFKPF